MRQPFFFYLYLLILVAGCSTATKKSTDTNEEQAKVRTVYDIVRDHQVLLTNAATFKGHTSLYGGSAFLINYENDVYAITARHLVGEAGGVEPEIPLKNLNNAIRKWDMYPRVPVNGPRDTIKVKPGKLNYDSIKSDILMLEIRRTRHEILPLDVRFDAPAKGDTFYLIGCPYSQLDCKQNIYRLTYQEYYAKNDQFYFLCVDGIELPGFSGAPIVDKQGKAFAVLCTGLEVKRGFLVGGTALGEIAKISGLR